MGDDKGLWGGWVATGICTTLAAGTKSRSLALVHMHLLLFHGKFQEEDAMEDETVAIPARRIAG